MAVQPEAFVKGCVLYGGTFGAMLGSMWPVAGTVIGACLGAVVGTTFAGTTLFTLYIFDLLSKN